MEQALKDLIERARKTFIKQYEEGVEAVGLGPGFFPAQGIIKIVGDMAFGVGGVDELPSGIVFIRVRFRI